MCEKNNNNALSVLLFLCANRSFDPSPSLLSRTLTCISFGIPVFDVIRKALIAVNDPFWRSAQRAPLPGQTTDIGSPTVTPTSTVIPALSAHRARLDVQSAILHILNEEGATSRLCRAVLHPVPSHDSVGVVRFYCCAIARIYW